MRFNHTHNRGSIKRTTEGESHGQQRANHTDNRGSSTPTTEGQSCNNAGQSHGQNRWSIRRTTECQSHGQQRVNHTDNRGSITRTMEGQSHGQQRVNHTDNTGSIKLPRVSLNCHEGQSDGWRAIRRPEGFNDYSRLCGSSQGGQPTRSSCSGARQPCQECSQSLTRDFQSNLPCLLRML